MSISRELQDRITLFAQTNPPEPNQNVIALLRSHLTFPDILNAILHLTPERPAVALSEEELQTLYRNFLIFYINFIGSSFHFRTPEDETPQGQAYNDLNNRSFPCMRTLFVLSVCLFQTTRVLFQPLLQFYQHSPELDNEVRRILCTPIVNPTELAEIIVYFMSTGFHMSAFRVENGRMALDMLLMRLQQANNPRVLKVVLTQLAPNHFSEPTKSLLHGVFTNDFALCEQAIRQGADLEALLSDDFLEFTFSARYLEIATENILMETYLLILSQRMIQIKLQAENIAEDKRQDWIQAQRDDSFEEMLARLRQNRTAFLSAVDILVAANIANEQDRNAIQDPTTLSGLILSETATPLPTPQLSHDIPTSAPVENHPLSEIGLMGTRSAERLAHARTRLNENPSKYSPQGDYSKRF